MIDVRRTTISAEERLRLLEALSGTVFGGRSVREILDDHAKLVCEVMDVDMCIIRRLVGNEIVLLGAHGIDAVVLNDRIDANVGISGLMIRNRRPVGIENVNTHPDSAPYVEKDRPVPYCSFAGTPMMLGEEIVGIMGIFCTKEYRVFQEEDLDLLFALGSNFAAAIRNHELFQELNQLNEELESRVRQRTAELQQANQDLESFVYSVAHDLRTPLRSIVSNARILVDDFESQIPDDAVPLLLRQSTAANRLAEMMDGLLQLARIGKQKLVMLPVDLSELASEIIREHLRQVPSDPPNIDIQPGIIVRGDASLLRVLIQNLIDNSLKFVQPGKTATIRIHKLPNDKKGAFVFEDEGIGFDGKYSDKLFQPFERLVSAEDYPGTGIGLATVKKIVERHRGTVTVESAPGHGAKFTFKF